MTGIADFVDRSEFVPDAVLRAKLAHLSIVSRRSHGYSHTGSRRSRTSGSSLEVVDHRAYSPGDDYRHIDWNVYARTDALFVKVRESEETLVVHLLLDSSGSMESGRPSKFKTARAVVAALGWRVLVGRDVLSAASLDIGLNSDFPSGQGYSHIGRFFDFMARLRPSGETHLGRAVAAYNSRELAHGVAILVSDLLTPDATEAVGRLAQAGHELTVIHVLDENFVAPVLADEVQLVDAEGAGVIEIFGDEELMRAYRQAVARWTDQLRSFCHSRSVRYVPIMSEWSVEEIVLRRLRQHGVLW